MCPWRPLKSQTRFARVAHRVAGCTMWGRLKTRAVDVSPPKPSKRVTTTHATIARRPFPCAERRARSPGCVSGPSVAVDGKYSRCCLRQARLAHSVDASPPVSSRRVPAALALVCHATRTHRRTSGAPSSAHSGQGAGGGVR